MSATTLPAAAAKRRNRVPEQVIRLGIVVVLIFAIIILGCAITDRFGRANNSSISTSNRPTWRWSRSARRSPS